MKGHLLYNSLVSSPWLATMDCVQHLHEVYWRIIDRKAEGELPDLDALAKELGRPLDNTRHVETRDGVAIIPIVGKIMPRADLFTEISGGVTVDVLARDFNTALNNPSVRAILLSIDSPGGQANGINEFAGMVYAARGVKPVVAYVPHEAASAAMWIASAAAEIVIDASASLGSIGVVGMVSDPAKQNSRHIQFVSSQSPKKRPDPTTTEGKSDIQSWVDSLAEVFIEAVARNRDVSADTVINDFGKGGVLVGRAAVVAGMADRVGSFEQVLSELSSGTYSNKKRPRMVASGQATNPQSEVNMADEKKPSIWARIFGREVSADEQKELAAELGTATSQQPPAQPAAAAPPPASASNGDAEEMQRLRTQINTERNARIASEAQAFAAGEITARRALPAERASIISLYTQAAMDDAAHPAQVGYTVGTETKQGTRVEALRAASATRPAHNLTRELVAFDDKTMQQLASGDGAKAELDAAYKQGEEYAAQANRAGGKK